MDGVLSFLKSTVLSLLNMAVMHWFRYFYVGSTNLVINWSPKHQIIVRDWAIIVRTDPHISKLIDLIHDLAWPLTLRVTIQVTLSSRLTWFGFRAKPNQWFFMISDMWGFKHVRRQTLPHDHIKGHHTSHNCLVYNIHKWIYPKKTSLSTGELVM